MDISETTAPKSDQQQFDDYVAGPKTFTITGVTKGSSEQPVNVELAEAPGRPFRPNKTMRRLMIAAWGKESSAYVGRRIELFGNPAVVFGGKPVGGVEISAMSHIDGPLTVSLTTTRGKKKPFTVQPLPAGAPSRDWLAELEQTEGDVDLINALGQAAKQAGAPDDVLAVIRAAYQKVKTQS